MGTNTEETQVQSTDCFLVDEVDKLHKFDLILSGQNFKQGLDLCEELVDGLPASFANNDEFRIARKLVKEVPLPEGDLGNIYIGLHDPIVNLTKESNDTTRFSWIDGTDFTFGSVPLVRPWNMDEPNNFQGKSEGCVELVQSEFFWNDLRCSNERRMLCRSVCSPSNPSVPSPITTSSPMTTSPPSAPTDFFPISPSFLSSSPSLTPSPPPFVPQTTDPIPSSSNGVLIGSIAGGCVLLSIIIVFGLLSRQKIIKAEMPFPKLMRNHDHELEKIDMDIDMNPEQDPQRPSGLKLSMRTYLDRISIFRVSDRSGRQSEGSQAGNWWKWALRASNNKERDSKRSKRTASAEETYLHSL